MKEEFQKYCLHFLAQFTNATAEEKKFLISQIRLRNYSKKEFFFKSGEIQQNMGYVCKGLLRRYYINEKGNKITTGFVNENKYATDYPAFINQRATKYFMECLEPSIVLLLPYRSIQEGYKRFKTSEMYGRKIAEKVLSIQTQRVESFLFENAEERYLNFIRQNPELINRISLSHLSSFLGIERQSLSRIRSRLARE